MVKYKTLDSFFGTSGSQINSTTSLGGSERAKYRLCTSQRKSLKGASSNWHQDRRNIWKKEQPPKPERLGGSQGSYQTFSYSFFFSLSL